MTGAAYSTGAGWWNDADGKAGTLRAEGHPHEANLLAANVRNGSLSSEVTGTLLAHKEGWSVNDLPMVLQEPQAFVKAKRASSTTDDDTWREEPVSPTLNVFDNGSDTRSTVLFVQPTEPTVFFPSKFAGFDEGVGTLRARDAKGDANVVVQTVVASGAQGQNHVAHGTIVNALTANMVGAGGGPDDNSAQANHLVAVQLAQSPTGRTDVAGTLGGPGSEGGFRFDLESCGAYVVVEPPEFAKTLTTSNQRLDPETETFIVQEPLAFTVKGNGEAWVQDMVTGITTGGGLPGQGYPAVIQPVVDTFAFQPADQVLGKGALRAVRTDVAPTIALGDHHSDRGLRIVQEVQLPALVRMREGKDGGGKGPLVSEQASLTLATGNDQVLFHEVTPVAFSAGNSAEAYGIGLSEDVCPPLRAAASGSNQVPTVMYKDDALPLAGDDGGV